MKIKLKFFASIREITCVKEDEIEFSGKINVKELLARASKRYGEHFTDFIYDKKGDLREYIQILINGGGINTLQGFETKLNDGDIVALLPPVGGG